MSCLLLAYSAYAVPMQLSFWDREDPCNPFPTLYIDIFVDTFFMVLALPQSLRLRCLLPCPPTGRIPCPTCHICTFLVARALEGAQNSSQVPSPNPS